MNEILKLIRASKTAKAGIVTIVWGILLLFGITDQTVPPAATIDDMDKPQQKQTNTTETAVGVGALLSGLMTLKGRNDAEKKIKELEDAK
jgi:hypothetical protein